MDQFGYEQLSRGTPQIMSVLVKPVSFHCNLACKYCFYLPKSTLYPGTEFHRMSDRVLRELIAQLMSLSLDQVSFCWQGGEPLLAGLNFYRNVVKYQSLFQVPGQRVDNNIQTNGTLINEEWARFFKAYNFLVGVSLDGPKSLHDLYRRDPIGNPSYDRVMNGIQWLKRYNVDFNILVLLNNWNVKYPRRLYSFLLKEGFHYLQFIPCVEKDPVKGSTADYSITPEEYGRFLCTVFDEWIRDGIPKIYIRDFEAILISYVYGQSPICTYSRECGGYVVVEYNGDVYPCDFHVDPEWLLGNLMEQPLEEIITNKKFTKFKKMKERLSIRCRGCPWLQYCRGGCPRHWNINSMNSNYFCPSYKMFFEHAHREFLRLKHYVKKKLLTCEDMERRM